MEEQLNKSQIYFWIVERFRYLCDHINVWKNANIYDSDHHIKLQDRNKSDYFPITDEKTAGRLLDELQQFVYDKLIFYSDVKHHYKESILLKLNIVKLFI